MNAENKKLKKMRVRKEKTAPLRKRFILKGLLAAFVIGIIALSALNPNADLSGKNICKASFGLSAALLPFMKVKQLEQRMYNGGGGGGLDTLTDDQKAFLEVIKTQIKPLFDIMLSEKFKPEDKDALDKLNAVKDKLENLKDIIKKSDFDALKEDLQTIGLKVEAIKEKPNHDRNAVAKSIATQMKEYAEANKEEWESFKKSKGKGTFSFPIAIKAAGTILESGNLNGSAYLPIVQMLPGVIDLVRNRPFLEQYISSMRAESPVIVWINKYNAQGQATMTAEGALKPLVDFELKTETSNAKKVTAAEKVSMEMLNDFAFMGSMMEQELRFQVDTEVDNQLLTGDGTGDNLKGITEYATAYTLTTVETNNNPNNADAIIAAMAQLESLNFTGTHCFINPIDKANMKLTKTATGERLVSLSTDEDCGVTIISNNKIPVGYFLLADLSKYKKFDLETYTASLGWENDDFRKNLLTMLGERRLHAFASENHAGAFIYDTFDNVKTALAPAP